MKIDLSKFSTLVGFCLCTFTNALGFGRLVSNLNTFGFQINISFFIGLFIEILLCIPAMKILEWRLDYSMYAASFLTMSANWMSYFSYQYYSGVFGTLVFNSLGQLFVLPTFVHIADIWFHLQERSIVISICLYSNLLGFATSAIITSLYVGDTLNNVKNQSLAFAIFASANFLCSIVLIKNKPKVQTQKHEKICLRHLKYLWRHKFDFYGIVMESVFLGTSWSFIGGMWIFLQLFDSIYIGIMLLTWAASGMVFGLCMSYVVNYWIRKTGNFFFYDLACKLILLVGLVSYLTLGICFQYKIDYFPLYVLLIAFVGIGSVGYYGLVFLSLVETMYPIPPLAIGTIVAAGASIYSALVALLSNYTIINPFFSMVIIIFLPLLYVMMVYKTQFKRYKYYLNKQRERFQFFRVDSTQRQQLPFQSDQTKEH